VHLANTLKHTVKKRNAKISTSGIAIVSTMHGYSRQRRTIASFSAAAGCLSKFFHRQTQQLWNYYRTEDATKPQMR